MTGGEMAAYIAAQRRRDIQVLKNLSQIAYAAGLVASTSLSTKRPRYEDLFSFTDEENKIQPSDIELHKRQMLVWAENVNRAARASKRGS